MSTLTESDLIFPSAATSISSTLTSLKRANLSITNRLHSIHADANFVHTVANALGFPLVANERCGSWYVRPETKCGSAYFKSTDGHTGQWAFSLRRLNLQILDVVGEKGGCIIVDSTRRGKSMPDALSKTAPIWIAVMNALLFEDRIDAHLLRTPSDVVSASEHAQIEARLPELVSDARKLDLNLSALRARLKKPMQAMWVTPKSDLASFRAIVESDDYASVVLCTASSRLSASRELDAAYVQGAADDSEAWALDLDAVTFWSNVDLLLGTREDELPRVIATLLASKSTHARLPVSIEPVRTLAVSDNEAVLDPRLQDYDVIVYIALALPVQLQGDKPAVRGQLMHLPCGSGKLASRQLRLHLTKLQTLSDIATPGSRILVSCDSGRDVVIGVALAILCMYYDENGRSTLPLRQPPPSKNEIKKRLSWIMASIPDVSPSRATLQSVNAFLMS